ncbi:MAG TPA: four helix bundle protein [Cyclobacteriaceae bacterium]|nr:four helix bundle protein [Cyclobacteriaceae bacterium]
MKTYNLEERTFLFSKQTAFLARKAKTNISNGIYLHQLIRSSSSIGSNYIEANESLGKKDCLLHLRIARKEAKESAYWLRLILTDESVDKDFELLLKEAIELKLILSSIIVKISKKKDP